MKAFSIGSLILGAGVLAILIAHWLTAVLPRLALGGLLLWAACTLSNLREDEATREAAHYAQLVAIGGAK